MIRRLLPATRVRDQVLEIVGRVIADNETLRRQLAKLLLHGKKNEGVSTLQLRLVLGAIGIAGVDGTTDDGEALHKKVRSLNAGLSSCWSSNGGAVRLA